MTNQFITRFAPSPTGRLHIGHAFSALLAYSRTVACNGRFILRIEDIDQARYRPEFETGIFADLEWLGLTWEGDVRRQSQNFQDYRSALDRLQKMGVLYPCVCTRREIREEVARSPSAPHGPEGALYPGTCRGLPLDEPPIVDGEAAPFALRLDVERAITLVKESGSWPLFWQDEAAGKIEADPASLGDVVLARKEAPASYHLSVVVDDAVQGITHIFRGDDLFHATHVHRLLQELLGLPAPIYHHHKLLTDEAGRRYAKRDKAQTLESLRENGRDPRELARELTATL